MQVSGQGCYVFSWDQVELDGLTGSLPDTAHVGATWRWSGHAMRIDDPRDILKLEFGRGPEEITERVARKIRRIFAERLPEAAEYPEEEEGISNVLELTDGLQVFRAVLLPAGRAGAPLIMFEQGLPPTDTDLWVLRQDVTTRDEASGQGLICFLPGTMIETPLGDMPVETIRAGDRVFTRDGGPRDVLWTGRRRISASRVIAMPDCRPVRIRAGLFGHDLPQPDLYLSPDHRLLLRGGPGAPLFSSDEVLVTARDLLGLPGVTRDNRPRAVEYVHLMLDGHHVLHANGMPAESFHPATADLGAIDPAAVAHLENLLPDLRRDPMRFGAFARRLLDSAEAALFLHGLGRHGLPGALTP